MTIELETAQGDTEAEAIARIAQQAEGAAELEAGMVYALLDGNGGIRIADTDSYAETPRRASGKRVVLDAASFVAYVNRHVTAGTEVYADTPNSTVRAVIDSHEGGAAGEPGWQGHKLDLSLEHTKAWNAWVGHDLGQNSRAWFGQQEFAEFIEDRALDVVEPDHGALVDIATTFEAKQKADFASAVRTDSGAVQFAYTETVAAKAGQKGTLEIPKVFRLALRPYIGGPIYYLTAQFRYRISGNGLLLGYALERPENILEAAFSDIVTEIRDGRTVTVDKVETREHDGIGDVPIFYGRP